MHLFASLFLFATYMLSASAHYFFPHFIANGNFTAYHEFVRENDEGFMPTKNGYQSTDFRCRVGSQAYASRTGVYKVKAGDEIGFGQNFGGKIGHPGPMQVYLSKAPGDVRNYDGSGDWFKIWELGPKTFSNTGIEWGAYNIGNFTFTLPEETPAGQYLVRIEHIGIHGAIDFGNAEFYYNCAQIEVESNSTATPSPLVKIPGLYTGYEPGILFNMYRSWIVNYTMPGPVAWPKPLHPNITASGISIPSAEESWVREAVTSTLMAPVSKSTSFTRYTSPNNASSTLVAASTSAVPSLSVSIISPIQNTAVRLSVESSCVRRSTRTLTATATVTMTLSGP